MKIVRSAFWASIYAGVGGLILNLSGGLWSDGYTKLGLDTPVQMPITQTFLFGLLSFFVLILLITSLVSIQIVKDRQPFIIGVTAAFLTLSVYFLINLVMLGSMYPMEIATFGSFWSLIFGFLNGGIVGCSLYLHLVLDKKSKMKIENEHLGEEMLKLEHIWFLTAFTSVSYVSMIFVVSAVLVSWTQMILPGISPEKIQTVGTWELFMTSVIQLVYIGTGLWLGIVGKLLGYSLRIHKRMLELKVAVS